MQIIGDRHYKAAAGEIITFTVGETTHVGAVVATVDTPPAGPLPVSVIGAAAAEPPRHHLIAITVGFTGDEGGSAVIEVSGSFGLSDPSRIRQITSLPFRSGFFVVD